MYNRRDKLNSRSNELSLDARVFGSGASMVVSFRLVPMISFSQKPGLPNTIFLSPRSRN